MKKAQLSLFIILGILILAAIAILFFANNKIISEKETINPDIQPLYNYVQSCIKQYGEDAVYTIGQRGGYFFTPDLSTEDGNPYYFSQGKNYMPTKQKVENEISEYVNELLYICIKDFSDFPDFNVLEGQIRTNTTILDNKILINVIYPLTIKKGSKTYSIKNFRGIEIQTRLGIIYDFCKKIIDDQMKHPESICLTCITNSAIDNELFVDILDYDKESVIIYIRDEKSKILGEDYVYKFANKYEVKNE